jgi:predicted nucleic acid-binding protein
MSHARDARAVGHESDDRYKLTKTAFPSGQTVGGLSDPDDVPILDAALSGDVDILISGDRRFLSLGLSRPKAMNPAEFLAATANGAVLR